jgi:hypothetical protein
VGAPAPISPAQSLVNFNLISNLNLQPSRAHTFTQEDAIEQQVSVLPLGLDPHAFTLSSLTPTAANVDDDALFAPMELSWREEREGSGEGCGSKPRGPDRGDR